MTWMAVWTRAVVVPAARRAMAVWVGAVIGGGIIFGGTGMQPRDLTGLALRAPMVGAVLFATWILVFVPAARLLVRWDAAVYLRALPAPRATPIAAAAGALIALQLPWLVLWLVGDGAEGAVVVVAVSAPIAALARWRPRPPRARWPRWRSAARGLAGVYARALTRRAGFALVRGAGLGVLAGVAAGLLVRNNAFTGAHAATLASGAIAIALIPGWVGALVPLLDAHRASAWLAASLGVSERARIAVLAAAVAGVYIAAAAIAAGAAALFIGDAATLPWLAGAVIASAAATALLATRWLVWANRSEVAPAVRAVVAAVLASAATVLSLGLLGLPGIAALAATGVLALATVKP